MRYTEELVLIEAQKQPEGLAKNLFKLKIVPTDCTKTSLDDLQKVENHLNKGVAFADWLGIRVYEPEKGEDGEVVWHLRRNLAP